MEYEWRKAILSRRSDKGITYIGLYVDDPYLTSDDEALPAHFEKELLESFDLEYFREISEYLGIQFEITLEGLLMSQIKYLKNHIAEIHKFRSQKTNTLAI